VLATRNGTGSYMVVGTGGRCTSLAATMIKYTAMMCDLHVGV